MENDIMVLFNLQKDNKLFLKVHRLGIIYYYLLDLLFIIFLPIWDNKHLTEKENLCFALLDLVILTVLLLKKAIFAHNILDIY